MSDRFKRCVFLTSALLLLSVVPASASHWDITDIDPPRYTRIHHRRVKLHVSNRIPSIDNGRKQIKCAIRWSHRHYWHKYQFGHHYHVRKSTVKILMHPVSKGISLKHQHCILIKSNSGFWMLYRANAFPDVYSGSFGNSTTMFCAQHNLLNAYYANHKLRNRPTQLSKAVLPGDLTHHQVLDYYHGREFRISYRQLISLARFGLAGQHGKYASHTYQVQIIHAVYEHRHYHIRYHHRVGHRRHHVYRHYHYHHKYHHKYHHRK